jgi:hypothetical protein
VLAGAFDAGRARSHELLAGTREQLGQAEVTALRLEGTARGLSRLAGGDGAGPGGTLEALDRAVERAESSDMAYELALSLSARSLLASRLGQRDEAGVIRSERPGDDDGRASALFDALGVTQAVITWSKEITGEPIFARS